MRSFPLLALATAALWARSRTRRQNAERLAAATLETLLNAVDANDTVTGAHMRRTAAYALILARAAKCDRARQRGVERVALFHDIGKLDAALFDIVHENTTLTPEQRETVAAHPQLGAEVLQPLARFYPDLPDGVRSHHERWDGTGYPRQLRGAAIPMEARIVAIADTFDALTHTRPYHRGESTERAAEIIRAGRGTQFDPALVDLFLSPAVFEQIVAYKCARATPEQRRVRDDRRATEQHDRERVPDVPDVRFRWQTSS